MRGHKSRVKFRHNVAVVVAAVLACVGAIPVAAYRWYLTPIIVVPLLVAVWGLRAGTDADREGLTVRALLASRRFGWREIEGFATRSGRVAAVTGDGRVVPLTAVRASEIDRLVAASGQLLHSTGRAPHREFPDYH